MDGCLVVKRVAAKGVKKAELMVAAKVYERAEMMDKYWVHS